MKPLSHRAPSLWQPVKRDICPSCKLHKSPSLQRRFLSHSRPLHKNLAPKTKYAKLTNRALIRLSGPDAANFLHNIIPAKILGVGTNPIYTAFLSAQGRILNDVFVYPPSWDGDAKHEWFIELDARSAADLLKHLKKHKLRAKLKLERVDGDEGGLNLVYIWPGIQHEIDLRKARAGGQDPRPGMGMRMIVNRDTETDVLKKLADEGSEESPIEDYTVHRMLNGMAEGQDEIIPGHALPQESNIDLLGGIDFHKGCYLGQELTIRTHHTGVVRKRILPCQLYDTESSAPHSQNLPAYDTQLSLPQPPTGSNMSKLTTRKGRSTGKWLEGVGNIGLALCRLEMMTDIQLTADTTGYNASEEYKAQWEINEGASRDVRIKPFVPNWIREGIEQNLHRKDNKQKKRQEEEEEDDDVD